MSKGCSNFSFGNARTTLKGGGGSGEPTTREVFQGVRADLAGLDSPRTHHTRNPPTNMSANAHMPTNRRRPSWESFGMSSTPEGKTITRVHAGAGRAEGPL